jgi:hypothetical protein
MWAHDIRVMRPDLVSFQPTPHLKPVTSSVLPNPLWIAVSGNKQTRRDVSDRADPW